MSTNRGYVIQVRVTKTEQNAIRREAREAGLSVADLIRRRLIEPPDIFGEGEGPIARGDGSGSKTKREA